MKNAGYALPRVYQLFVAALLPIVVLAAVVSLTERASAQQPDSKGREFWACFMTNEGGGVQYSDLRLYLSCDKVTTARITYTLTGQTISVPLNTPNVPQEVLINTLFGDLTELDMVMSSANAISQKSFHIVADNEITLYGANFRPLSADAFLGLPVDVLTGRYIVLGYPNGYLNGFGPGSIGKYDMPSEFAVIATQDSTIVTIDPKAVLVGQAGAAPFTVTLNRGEVYFGQAVVYGGSSQDVSGTQVNANAPVAVFGGNRRTSIPTRVGNFRDHLVEQLPPLDAWGRAALATPHFTITPGSRDTAVVRIIAALPGTDVTIVDALGTRTQTLSSGVSFEVPLLRPMSITATQPIMVAQYEHSVNAGQNAQAQLGDPFMMLIPPPEQFDTAYAFQSINYADFRDAHYINIVIPPQGMSSLRLDGAPVGATFNTIPGSSHVYAQVHVTEGSHYIKSDSAFGLYVYGFGVANSYGYPGGMLFRKLVRDFESPDMLMNVGCADAEGFTYDSRITDTGIDSCIVTQDTQNVVVKIDPFKRSSDTVRFTARLIDPYRDGVVAIRSVDGAGHVRTQSKSIPGFTVRYSGSPDAPAVLDTFMAINARDFCRTIELKNYGKFDQRVNGVAMSDSAYRTINPSQFPLVIPPGGLASFEICFSNVPDTILTTLLTLLGDCSTRDAMFVPVDSRVDTSAPSVGIEGTPCGDDFIVTYFERRRASGIAAITVDSLVNCTAENLVDPSKLPAQQVQVKLHRLDPRQDLIYQVTLFDGAGNKLIDRDTIGGFTLNALSRTGDTLGMRYEHEWGMDSLTFTDRRCDSVTITNYGNRYVNITRAVMHGNVMYSIPPSQFPMSIRPGGSVRLMVCLEGRAEFEIADTLDLIDGCGHVEGIAMKAPVRTLQGLGGTTCGATLSFATLAPAKRAFMTTPHPNPVEGRVHLEVGLPAATGVTLDVYSIGGDHALQVLANEPLPAGISLVGFDVSGLTAGSYLCRMRTAEGKVLVEKLVVRR